MIRVAASLEVLRKVSLTSDTTNMRVDGSLIRATIVAAGSIFATGCSGASGSSHAVIPPSGASQSVAKTPKAATAPLHLSLVVPPARAAKYVSSATESLVIAITPQGAAALAPVTFACTSASCDATLPAPVGTDRIALSLTDGANGSGSALSLAQAVPVTITPGVTNTVLLTANPIINAVSVSIVGGGTIPAGTPATAALDITATDPDGRIIVGPGHYVDANGQAVTLTVSTTDTRAGGSGTSTLIGDPQLTSPSQTISVHYDGGWMASSSIAITSTGSGVSLPPTTVLTMQPHVYEYPVGGTPQGITTGPDGKIWYTSPGVIGNISTDGTGVTQFPFAGNPYTITSSSDGNLYFTDYVGLGSGGGIYRCTTSGVTTRLSNDDYAYRVVADSFGNIWATTEGGVDEAPLSGPVAYLTYGGLYDRSIYGMAFGPDGNLWFIAAVEDSVVESDLTGNVIQSYPVPSLSIYSDLQVFSGVAKGSDGLMWFADYDGNVVQKVSATGGTITPYGLPPGAGPLGLVSAPDGAIWFAENGTNSIGRLTTSGALTEYGASSGINLSAAPQDITVGRDGNIWFTENGSGSVGKFVL